MRIYRFFSYSIKFPQPQPSSRPYLALSETSNQNSFYFLYTWVTWIIEDINMTVQEKDIAMADLRIKYLEKKISEINTSGLKNLVFH